MSMDSRALVYSIGCLLALSSRVGAEPPAPRATQDAPQGPSPDSSVAAPPPMTRERAERARFSFGRYLVESIGSGLVVGVLSYAAYKTVCGDDPCIGGFALSTGVSMGMTPLGTWMIGNALGGAGELGFTYLAGLSTFSATGSASTQSPLLLFSLQIALEPFAAAVGYEVSSNTKANKVLRSAGIVRPRLGPWIGAGGHMDGFGVRASASF